MTTEEPFDPLRSFAAIERLVSKIYFRFSHLFLGQPELRDFWWEMAREEEQHGCILQACREIIENFAEPTLDPTINRDKAQQLSLWLNAFLAQGTGSLTVEEAFRIAVDIESSEIDTIYSKLTHWAGNRSPRRWRILASRRAFKDKNSKPRCGDFVPVPSCYPRRKDCDAIANPRAICRPELAMEFHLDNIIGKSKALRDVLGLVKKVANTQATVLITGASGTGKELIALALHALSDRKDKLFLPVNCGALPETLLESLLFGHMKGSFTGAFATQEGLLEKARGGTIFLDEIGEIPQHLQVKVLRALEAKEILPIGSTTPRQIDVRILAATNRDLTQEVAAGRFREDLFYRLNVMEIHIPPLQDRPEDIPLLIDYFIKRHNPELKRNFNGIDADAVQLLMALPWKGNVRELDNIIEHTMILAEGERIALKDLPAAVVASSGGQEAFTFNLKDSISQFEKKHIARVLDHTNQDRKEAAKLLDISLSSLYRKIEDLEQEKTSRIFKVLGRRDSPPST